MSGSADIRADHEEVCRAVLEKRAVDPAVSKRVRERAVKIRDELFRNHGLLDAAVDLIRESRD